MAAESSPYDRLWLEYHRTGDERLKLELTEKFKPILVSMAERLRAEMGDRPLIQDLINAGMLGLLEAFERFDPSRGVYFDTWCTWRVLGAMYDDQRKFDWAGGALRLKAQRLRAASDELTASLGRPPTDDELCETLGLSHADLTEIRCHGEPPAPLYTEGPDASGDSRPSDPALADQRLDPERVALVREARDLLYRALAELSEKQRLVLQLYYLERLKMADIGLVLGLSEARVSQLRKEAIATLLRRLGPRRDDLLDALGV